MQGGCRGAESVTPEQQARLREELQEQQLDVSIALKASQEKISRGMFEEIEVISVHDLLRHAHVLTEQIREFQPDFVLVSSEDLSHTLLREAAQSASARLVYLAHTPQWFPFGPASWNRDERSTGIVKDAAAIIVISHAMADYVQLHLGRNAFVAHPPIYGDGPWPQLGNFESGYIAMVNPCSVKGISLFLALADIFSGSAVCRVPGWGTTRQDIEHLKQRPNVTLLPRVKQIETFLARTKLLLMPSLWLEGFGLIAMEAMLRGVPVIASDSGGLREAKGETRFVIPVEPIERYEAVFDDRNMPKAVIPAQNTEPWVQAIAQVTNSRDAYVEEVNREQSAARQFVSRIDPLALHHVLASLPSHPTSGTASPKKEAADLSDAKRALLLKRLRERAKERRN